MSTLLHQFCSGRVLHTALPRLLLQAYYRFIMGACALALAIETSQDYEPVANSPGARLS